MFQIEEEKSKSGLHQGITKVAVDKVNNVAEGGKNRIEVFVKNDESGAEGKLTFFIENTNLTSKAGKMQYIDKFGRTQWAENAESLQATDYFNPTGARLSFKGEESLTKFIRSLFSIKPSVEGTFADPKAIAEGNMDEFDKYVKQIGDREVYVAFGVKDGKYQDIYNNAFDASWMKEGKSIMYALTRETYNKSFFGSHPFTFKKFDPSSAPQPAEENTLGGAIELPAMNTLESTFGDTSHLISTETPKFPVSEEIPF